MREQRIVLEHRCGRPFGRRHRRAVAAPDQHPAFASERGSRRGSRAAWSCRSRRGRAGPCSCPARLSSDTASSTACAPKRWPIVCGSDQRPAHLRLRRTMTSSMTRAQTIETPNTSEPTALVLGVRPERSSVPDLDRQGGLEPGQQEGDHELVPGKRHRQEEGGEQSGPHHRHGDHGQHLPFAAPRSRAARSRVI